MDQINKFPNSVFSAGKVPKNGILTSPLKTYSCKPDIRHKGENRMNAYPYYGKIQKTRINFKVVSVFLAVLFWICGFMMLHGQSDLNFEHLSELQGLSQNSVWSILQDREGFMWFGTQDGLNKYDGYNFTVLKPDPDDPENSLHHNIISDIYEDRKGRLWVTTFGVGFHQVDKHTGRVTRLVLSLPIQSSGMYLLPFMKTSKAYYGLVELEE